MTNSGAGGRSHELGFSVIRGETISRLVHGDPEGAICVIREAYLAHAHGQSINPAASFLKFGDKANARIIALPAHLDGRWRISGIKWIASFPDNIRDGLPRASAVLILNSHDCGFPFACLEASVISGARTAASAALAAELLRGGRRTHALGIVGTGFIARYVYRLLIATQWEIEKVVLYDIDPAEARRFAAKVCDGTAHTSVTIAADLPEALRSSDLILFSTVASKPYVHDAGLLEHHPTVLHISLRDLAPELLLSACNIVDDIDHVLQADTSVHLAEKLTRSRSFLAGTLAEVIEGSYVSDSERTVIFSPFGLGVLDLALGKWVYDRAVAMGEYCAIDDFFYDLER
jgi:N-[(2S)-2-amino-2-carboxyethyl]-L-glutamate dehydrogenase